MAKPVIINMPSVQRIEIAKAKNVFMTNAFFLLVFVKKTKIKSVAVTRTVKSAQKSR